MSRYLRQIVYKHAFDGDDVTITFNPMNVVDAVNLGAVKDGADVAGLFQPLVEKYIVSVEGLRAADGTEVSKEEFVRALYFLPLLVAAGVELLNGSRVSDPAPPVS